MWISGGGLACGLVVVMETKAQIEWQGHQYVFQYGKETAGQEALAFRLQSQRDLSAGGKVQGAAGSLVSEKRREGTQKQ